MRRLWHLIARLLEKKANQNVSRPSFATENWFGVLTLNNRTGLWFPIIGLCVKCHQFGGSSGKISSRQTDSGQGEASMMALRVHIGMHRRWQLDDLWASRQEGKHLLALIPNTQLMIQNCWIHRLLLRAHIWPAEHTNEIKSNKGNSHSVSSKLLSLSGGSMWSNHSSCVTSSEWNADEKNVGVLCLLPADPPGQMGREMVHAMATCNQNHTAAGW